MRCARFVSAVAVLLAALHTSKAAAQMFADPLSTAGAKTQMAGVFSASDIEYEEDGLSEDVERTILGVEAATGVSATMDGFAQLGLILDSEVGSVDDGKGFTLGLGARSIVHREAAYRVSAYGAFTIQKEEFEEGPLDIELETYDLHAGAVVGFNATPAIMPYAGLDLVLLSDGDIEIDGGGYNGDDADVERDDIVNLKLGGLFNPATPVVRAELVLMGEETFTVAVGTYF